MIYLNIIIVIYVSLLSLPYFTFPFLSFPFLSFLLFQAVLRMLSKIGSPNNVPEFIESVKVPLPLLLPPPPLFSLPLLPPLLQKARKEKLMGFGHRVYKNFDPRALLLKDLSTEVTINNNANDIISDPITTIIEILSDLFPFLGVSTSWKKSSY